MNCASFFIKKIALKILLSSAIFKLPFDFHFFRYNGQNRGLIIGVFLGKVGTQSISRGIGGGCERVGIGRYEIKKSNSISELLFIRRRRHTLPQQV